MRNIFKHSKWMEGYGPEADIVLSSRVRLARNFKDIPFPQVLSEQKLLDVADTVEHMVPELLSNNKIDTLEFILLDKLSALEKQILVEKHLISIQLAEGGKGKAVLLNNDESISIMVNEEDHLRIQCLLPALQLNEALRIANLVDDALESKLDYAFREPYGYLTSCPTNVGTGLRASVMMHLPGLVITNQVKKVLSALPRVGLTVRGLYGEGSEASGNLFQISNQITLGQSEEDIIYNLNSVCNKIIEQERSARKAMQAEWKIQLEDKVNRAYGLLTHAKVISSEEAIRLLSDLRLGITMNLINGVKTDQLNELLVAIQPASLQAHYEKSMSSFERDVKRGELIKKILIEK
ncbi:protein arginine kinase [Bacillota bacterium LX-D]|nr:protein arginine kinase [Bacillota bacterium LX-D]